MVGAQYQQRSAAVDARPDDPPKAPVPPPGPSGPPAPGRNEAPQPLHCRQVTVVSRTQPLGEGAAIAATLAVAPGSGNVLPCLGTLLGHGLGMLGLCLVVSVYYVAVPLNRPRTAPFSENWSYGLLQPFVVFCYVGFGSAFSSHTLLEDCCPTTVKWRVNLALAGVAGLLGLLVLSLPTRYLGFYPFNFFAGYIVHGALFYGILKPVVIRTFPPPEHRARFKELQAQLQQVGNAYLVGLMASIGFLVAFYKSPAWAQILTAIAYNLVMKLATVRLRGYCVKVGYPLRLYLLLAVSIDFIHEVFLSFAYPSALSPVTLALMFLGQVAAAAFVPFSYTQTYVRLMQRLFPSFHRDAVSLCAKVLADLSGMTCQALAPVLFILLSLGLKHGPNKEYYPFARLPESQYDSSLAFSAIVCAAGAAQLAAVLWLLEAKMGIPALGVLQHYGLGGWLWRWAAGQFVTVSVVIVAMVLQMHCNMLPLLRPTLYP